MNIEDKELRAVYIERLNTMLTTVGLPAVHGKIKELVSTTGRSD